MAFTHHRLLLGDARSLSGVGDGEAHLVVTSPPYWTLKVYNSHERQLGAITEYDEFLDELDHVWRECYRALAPGGRMCIVVGDVCLSRRKTGRHRVVPLHADITTRCVRIGFDNLAPIFWYKIANIQTEMDRPGYFLGKPFEPNGIIKNDVEFILLLRKPGEYRHPSPEQRELSRIPKDLYAHWYRQLWDDIPGASTRDHPAPYPIELAGRLIRMFSFAGDIVLDPFIGTGTTSVAAMDAGRDSIGVEVDPAYFEIARKRMTHQTISDVAELSFIDDSGATTLTRQPLAHVRPLARPSGAPSREKRRARLASKASVADTSRPIQMTLSGSD